MPRKSKAQIELEKKLSEERKLRIREALRWSDHSDIDRDVPPPSGWNDLSTGWVDNPRARRVEVACSSVVYHSIGRIDKTTAQRPMSLHSTRLRALRALRAGMEHEFAEELMRVDLMIEEEMRKRDM